MAVPKQTDILVIGGGPAGLAAAIAARRKGFDVVVADAAIPPIDKACGEGLMPDSFPALQRLGVRLDRQNSFAFRGIRFIDSERRVEADFPNGSGTAMRRTRLHQALVDRAEEVGIRMLWGTRVLSLDRGNVTLDDSRIAYRWLIGADGQNSHVRRWAGLDRVRFESRRFGFRKHYRIAPWTEHMEIHWGNGAQLYATPVSGSEVCVALITRDSRIRLEQTLQAFPELSRRLAGAPATTVERGAVTISRSLKRVFDGNTILIGDASGSVDAITGEGLCMAFHQAIALADALAAGDLRTYQAAHRQLARCPHFMARIMLLLDHHPRLRARVMRSFVSEPEIFANLLAMHVGSIEPAEFMLHGILPLGRQILIAS